LIFREESFNDVNKKIILNIILYDVQYQLINYVYQEEVPAEEDTNFFTNI